MAAIGQEALKEAGYLGSLRSVDSLTHVVRIFDDPSIPHAAGDIDPMRDIKNVEFDLMVSDLGQIEKRLERMKKDSEEDATRGAGKRKRTAASAPRRFWRPSGRCARWR